MTNLSSETRAYHFLNIATVSNYERLKAIREKHDSWETAWQSLRKKYTIDEIKELQILEASGCRLFLASDTDFPALLREIPWTPHGLYIKGAPPDQKLKIAIVGTRRVTPQGKAIAKRFAEALARRGIIIVSGLALGVDGAAHEGTLAAGGKTIAVLANGLDRIYPREHESLGEKIIKGNGTLISEYPPGAPSLPHRFIERNRIVSGLSKGTLIVEAPKKSGGLATARFALEQNREIFVIPGSIEHPNYQGSHELIKAGATLVTSPEDIINFLGLEDSPATEASPELLSTLDETERIVINVLYAARSPLAVDTITAVAQLTTADINRALSFLVIKGIVKDDGGTYQISK